MWWKMLFQKSGSGNFSSAIPLYVLYHETQQNFPMLLDGSQELGTEKQKQSLSLAIAILRGLEGGNGEMHDLPAAIDETLHVLAHSLFDPFQLAIVSYSTSPHRSNWTNTVQYMSNCEGLPKSSLLCQTLID